MINFIYLFCISLVEMWKLRCAKVHWQIHPWHWNNQQVHVYFFTWIRATNNAEIKKLPLILSVSWSQIIRVYNHRLKLLVLKSQVTHDITSKGFRCSMGLVKVLSLRNSEVVKFGFCPIFCEFSSITLIFWTRQMQWGLNATSINLEIPPLLCPIYVLSSN